ncbi:DNA recombination protein RmuC [Roseivirga misakiensis]|uniref:DNA polymerase V n=1 Tax=Roseivirga misakiensis TaxID=1563681 RepID=A0A1E5T4Y7_9BACT|nr:DNA recombination protein RmuC [Roseivirga misakiensis]OEK06377.1 DNA polymerase V [Roseivirga misakiensis]
MDFIWLACGIVLGTIIGWLFTQLRRKGSGSDELLGRLQLAEERFKTTNTNLTEVKSELLSEREKNQDQSNELTRVNTEFKNLELKLHEQQYEIGRLNEKFAIEFKNLANEIFEEKSKKFTAQNKVNLQDILSPLKEKIGEFQKRVEETNKDGAERNTKLSEQIKYLSELNKRITKEAEQLTKALKGDAKTQGNWGEVILERILEKSGLEKGREYETQTAKIGEDGKRYQPDVVVSLPEERHIIIDAKVSLTAYERFTSASDEEERAIQLKLHIGSIKSHIKGLSDKKYQNLYGLDGLDFVFLFIPIEPAFMIAVQEDPDLFNEAYAQNIVIISPTTLMATLRTISSIWKQEYQSKNAIEIARQSGALYDKFVGFTEDLRKIGDNLTTTQKNYAAALNKLTDGQDNLIRKTEKIKKLGAKTSKHLHPSLLNKGIEE